MGSPPRTRHSEPTAIVFRLARNGLEVKTRASVNVRVVELIDKATGSRIELEGNRIPVTHSKDVIHDARSLTSAGGARRAPGSVTSGAMSVVHADGYGDDLFTEPDGDADTLANLGPLRPLAGVWEGIKGDDLHPVEGGGDRAVFLERYVLDPIDFQTNGPQLFYGLRYHTHINEVGKPETFHDQVGYWLWEPATNTIVHTLTIPRGQVVVAGGSAAPDATEFEVSAAVGSPVYGISAVPFIDRGFRTTSFRIRVVTNADDTWSYDSNAMLEIPDRDEPFDHTDTNTLTRVAPPSLNPLAARAVRDGSLGIGDLRNESGNLP